MKSEHKILGFIAILVVLVIAGVVMFSRGDANVGGVLENQKKSFIEGLFAGNHREFEVDRDGEVSLGRNEGSCNLSQSVAGSHAATTSKEYRCAMPGVSAGDTVQIELPAGAGANTSGATSLYGGFVVNSAYATTSDFAGVTIVNLTGVASSSFAQATTTAKYVYWH